ncbi:unnamed protein product [Taenia asiatica]|uniref:Uncharacterized protein n=1 Tax=Taenia asiatica TaxID=60517 RepID=A0A0R3WES8_TAEAS|nr:unnamed protein product [Taenia asiatica]
MRELEEKEEEEEEEEEEERSSAVLPPASSYFTTSLHGAVIAQERPNQPMALRSFHSTMNSCHIPLEMSRTDGRSSTFCTKEEVENPQ